MPGSTAWEKIPSETSTPWAYPYWLVRKSTDGGNTWSTVHRFNPGQEARGIGIFSHPTLGLFTYGYADVTVTVSRKQATTQRYNYIRRSLDRGATWTSIYSSTSGFHTSLGADAWGNLYVVGSAGGHWIARKSADGGNTWNVMDDYQQCVVTSTKPYRTTCFTGVARGIASDSYGNVFVVGSSGSNWLVRASAGGTGAWQNVDAFPYLKSASAHAVIADAAGGVFVGGTGADPTSYGIDHWLVRKFAPPPP